MKTLLPISLLATQAWSSSLPPADVRSHDPVEPEHIFANPQSSSSSQGRRIPTSYESAVLGRRILALTPLGTLSTIFPSSSSDGEETNKHQPADIAGLPIALMDYIAPCDPSSPDSGNPTILAIKIATSFKNVRDGNNNISLSLQWTPPYLPDSRIEVSPHLPSSTWFSTFLSYMPWVTHTQSHSQTDAAQEESAAAATAAVAPARSLYSAANLPRFSLLGHIEPIPHADRDSDVAKCFVQTHPDAKYWLPGNRIHSSEFVRLVVSHVYWIGGFGDRAYIGWIPVEEWNSVTREEWEDVRLPGEKKGWKEWETEVDGGLLGLEL